MSDQRATSDSVSIEEAIFSNIWEIAAIVEECWSGKASVRSKTSMTSLGDFVARNPVPEFLRRPRLSRTSSPRPGTRSSPTSWSY